MAVNEPSAVLDIEQLTAVTGGDPGFVEELFSLYRETAPGLLQQVRDAQRRGDLGDLRKAAHTIRGASANVGASRVKALAYAVELLARDGDLTPAPAAISRLDSGLQELYAEMASTLRRLGP